MGCSSAKQIPAPLPPEKDSPVLTHTTSSTKQPDVRESEDADEENNQEVSDRGRHVNGEEDAGTLKTIVEDKYEPPKPLNRLPPHVSQSQQEFFRLLDQKIDQGRDYITDDEEAR
ncbi:C1orf21 [Branchiostoma lanceolatum]|uniref:C1orf21 protein n=1 Tax=Branchiostoma lanceolatum TaxID=7740 RepID=A0A8K0AD83_BRALA|nr:C1orf21 [Branchiostoma lanceolatum]